MQQAQCRMAHAAWPPHAGSQKKAGSSAGAPLQAWHLFRRSSASRPRHDRHIANVNVPGRHLEPLFRRLRRASTYAVNVGVSVRNTSNSVRCDAGRSAATRTDLIGSLCSGFS